MKKTLLFTLLLLLVYDSMAQKKETIDAYSQKFYKTGEKIYGLKNILPSKKLPRRFPDALLYCTTMQGDIECIFPPQGIIVLGSYYLNVRWDIDKTFFLNMIYWGSTEIGGERDDIEFYWLSKMEKWREILPATNKSGMSEEMQEENFNEKTTLSHNLTGISDFFFRRMMGKENPKGYWCYDLVLCEDETLLMPVMFADSLYLYKYTDMAWTKPDYLGAGKNAKNDRWTRTGQALCPFKTDFRAFQIEEDLYSLADGDSMLYKYENAGIREIGRIKPSESERTLFLVDKDDRKVYFLMAQSIDIIPEERERFALLGKEDELFRAVKRIIDEPDRK